MFHTELGVKDGQIPPMKPPVECELTARISIRRAGSRLLDHQTRRQRPSNISQQGLKLKLIFNHIPLSLQHPPPQDSPWLPAMQSILHAQLDAQHCDGYVVIVVSVLYLKGLMHIALPVVAARMPPPGLLASDSAQPINHSLRPNSNGKTVISCRETTC